MDRNLEWQVERSASETRLVLSGSITEKSDFEPLFEQASDKTVLNLRNIEAINSIGVREWIRFIDRISKDREIYLEECSAPLVRQLNMIVNMKGSAKVKSVLLPYYCSSCGNEQTQVYVLDESSPDAVADAITCSNCGQTAEFDDLVESYLSFTTFERS